MKMNTKIIKTLSIMGLFCFFGCNKSNDFKACISTDKDTYSINEEITFKNCSKFNKGDEKSGVVWGMGDGNSMFSFGNDSIVYQYEKAGEYIIKLIIGYKEGPQDEVEKTITIVE